MKIAWGSCSVPAYDLTAGYTIRRLGGYTAFFAQGDMPYCNIGGTAFGWTVTKVSVSTTLEGYKDHYRKMATQPGWQALHGSVGAYYAMADDHEWGGDNWDHTLTQSETDDPIGASTQADVDAHFYLGRQAADWFKETYCDNPANTDVGANTDKPSSAAAGTPASQYPVRYFRVGYDLDGNRNDANPYVEFIVIDCISYRSPIAATDNSSKTMLGATQKAWLKSRLLNSTATFKLVMTGKKLYRNTGADNNDIWGFYTTERDELLAYIDSNAITTVAWLAGDRHTSNVTASSKAGGATYDHVCVCACPIHTDINADGVNMNYSNYHVWLNLFNRVFGEAEVASGRLNLRLRDSYHGGVVWSGYIEAGSNTVKYDRPRIA